MDGELVFCGLGVEHLLEMTMYEGRGPSLEIWKRDAIRVVVGFKHQRGVPERPNRLASTVMANNTDGWRVWLKRRRWRVKQLEAGNWEDTY